MWAISVTPSQEIGISLTPVATENDHAILVRYKLTSCMPMPYCGSALKIKAPASASEVLSAFAKEQCNASQAHSLDGRQFNIDAGLNDLRAIQQDNPDIFGFFCRYQNDVNRTEVKIHAFAKDHPVECKLVDLGSL